MSSLVATGCFDDEDLALMDELAAEALSPTCLKATGGSVDPREFEEEEPPAWELPDSMLTGGMPANFEQTRRAVGDLTEQLAEKKDKIELLLERMSKLQARYAKMTEERETAEEMLLEAVKKTSPLPRRKKKKSRSKKKKSSPRKDKENAGTGGARSTPQKAQQYAHPLDDLKDFQENEDHPCNDTPQKQGASPGGGGQLVVKDRSPPKGPDGKIRHPLDDHFELGTEATEEAELEEHVSRILDWVDKCKEPGADPFGRMRREICDHFDDIAKTMHRIEGSSTQTFTPKGDETTLLEMLEARENALIEARDDLMQLHDETDDAEYFWSNMYCANCSAHDDDDDDDEFCSPEEAQLLLYLGKNLHDYMCKIEYHRDHLVDVSEKFDAGFF